MEKYYEKAFGRDHFSNYFYATLPYIRHLRFAGCYDNNHWYLVTNLAGHLDLAGYYFLNAPLMIEIKAFLISKLSRV